MANAERLCNQNYKIWAAFLIGMIVIVIAIVVFDKVLKIGRATDFQGPGGSNLGTNTDPIQATSYLSLKENSEIGAWLGIDAIDILDVAAEKMGHNISGGVLVGWGLMMWLLATTLYAKEPDLCRKIILTSIITWFTDQYLFTAASISTCCIPV